MTLQGREGREPRAWGGQAPVGEGTLLRPWLSMCARLTSTPPPSLFLTGQVSGKADFSVIVQRAAWGERECAVHNEGGGTVDCTGEAGMGPGAPPNSLRQTMAKDALAFPQGPSGNRGRKAEALSAPGGQPGGGGGLCGLVRGGGGAWQGSASGCRVPEKWT